MNFNINNLNISQLKQNPTKYSSFDLNNLNDMFSYMEELYDVVEILIVNNNQFKLIKKNMSMTVLDLNNDNKEGFVGHFFIADLYISDKLKDNQVITGNISKNTYILNTINQSDFDI